MESKKKHSTNFGLGILGIAAVGLVGYGIKKLFFDDDKPTKKGEEEAEEEIEDKTVDTQQTIDDIDEDEIAEEIKSFVCPITNAIMEDPVITPQGISYEKSAIEDWLKKHNKCPLTNKPLYKKDLIRNIALKNSIQEYIKRKKEKN